MDTIDGMRVFLRVVETGSFAEASRRLGISNALASKYLRQLEERLGARLLNRTTRSVSVTDLGGAYYERCARIVAELDELEESVTIQNANPRGLLRVAGSRAFGEDMLVPAIGRFMANYPEITVDLHLDERMIDVVGEGFDLAIRVGVLRDSGMIARPIADYPYLICAAPDYLDRQGIPEHPDDLRNHDCIVNTAIAPTGQWDFIVDGTIRHVPVRVRARVNAARATATLVRSGLGVGLCLFSTVRDDVAQGRLVPLLETFHAYQRRVHAVYPHSRHLTAKVRLFVDHLVAEFAGERGVADPC